MSPRLLKPHPLAELMPAMTEEEFVALKEDIEKHGVHEPVWVFENQILDGRHRARACDELDQEFEIREYNGTDPGAFVVSLNLHRRHLNREQKRALVERLLEAMPEKSNNAIARTAKVDDKTVAKVRVELEARSEIPNVAKRTDSKGREQPAKKSRATPNARSPKSVGPRRAVTAKELADDYRKRISHDYLELVDGQKQEFVRRLAAIIKMLTPKVAAPSADTITDAADAAVVLQ
jgi:ParB-like chromosome segregation protein Spo0J